MVGIYKYENGLKFTGIIAKTEEEAWQYLDKIHGKVVYGVKYGCNREAYVIKKVTIVGE
jgi:hypothetical protein